MEQRRADTIYEKLEELIFSSSFSNGDRLDEIKLAEQFKVSRTPIREAFQRLALSGLVELIPRRGAFVRQPGPVELLEMFEVMAELESFCSKLAAVRISDDALDDLRATNERCNATVAAKDIDGYYRENEHFHQIIYKESGNGFLEQEALRLHRRLKPFRRAQLKVRGRMKQSLTEHQQIVDALSDGDADLASQAIRQHVAVQGEKFHHLMASFKLAAE